MRTPALVLAVFVCVLWPRTSAAQCNQDAWVYFVNDQVFHRDEHGASLDAIIVKLPPNGKCKVSWILYSDKPEDTTIMFDKLTWEDDSKPVRNCVKRKSKKFKKKEVLEIEIKYRECAEVDANRRRTLKFDIVATSGTTEFRLDPKLEIERPGTLKE